MSELMHLGRGSLRSNLCRIMANGAKAQKMVEQPSQGDGVMSYSYSRIPFLTALLAAILIVAGCASYETQKTPTIAQKAGSQEEVSASNALLEVHAVPMLKGETAKAFLGINPSSTGMAPILFKIRNIGASPIKIDLSRSYLSSKSNERSPCLSLDEACKRALRSDAEVVGWTVAFGLVGGLVSGSKVTEANRTLESDYQQKQFKPTLINSGGLGEGVVFFDVPKEKQSLIRSAIIVYQDLGSNQPGEIVIDLGGYGME